MKSNVNIPWTYPGVDWIMSETEKKKKKRYIFSPIKFKPRNNYLWPFKIALWIWFLFIIIIDIIPNISYHNNYIMVFIIVFLLIWFCSPALQTHIFFSFWIFLPFNSVCVFVFIDIPAFYLHLLTHHPQALLYLLLYLLFSKETCSITI